MAAHTRWTRLLEILGNQGQIDVLDAAEQLGCSAATVRRDLDELARQNLLTRTRGGAVVSTVAYDLPLRYKAARRADEKQRIAKAAAELIPTGSTVGLNGGTTTSEVARELALRPEPSGGGVALTVVTNAINIANELAVRPQVKIVVTGGVARPNSYELVGPLVDSVLRTLALDYTILGVDAVHARFGAATHDESEAGANRALAECAGTVVVVADSSKLGRRAFAQVCETSAVSVLVTDRDAPEDVVEEFTGLGIDVLRV
ncbi:MULTISPECIES: DeoR/GlpR family DNA-binding transcription regulator [Streptomyces]|uniref:DeoR/GlpR family DNA-binding transcription regulator n=1 Tax=Streptomyces glycanivorans TaxID=3033808 RepID=A0ABY9JI33_9ACTN|nr:MULTISPECIES: DeoR/GlpR family DNA-binding transcription regulator [unclassified Streptomyces]WSQ79621.1 DeoR/GlpR family DNA-binding transcription regulator [Streptomyces sp. NBC_01213]WLQ66179.1 DeoR/GlpR family DNA-binding transcription regulator [Streptomyces sp. Alt3]WSQ87000.1 DeoR/GlpR family DNA-binding transcription regulator [Streptomyces sp. NBC_01212]WSR06981.1 DeoR/GlpR family DNA-binding transcription regulator [Streptomyces sp. NBC_01208]WSR50277.1 DeoR/GlpR family DNA-bindin